MNGLVNKAPMLKPFVPFVRTPLNIIKQGFYESTIFKPLGEGVGALKDAATAAPTERMLALQKRLLQDPEASFRIGGQIALTTAFGGAVWGLVMSGNMTGGGPGKWTVPELMGRRPPELAQSATGLAGCRQCALAASGSLALIPGFRWTGLVSRSQSRCG